MCSSLERGITIGCQKVFERVLSEETQNSDMLNSHCGIRIQQAVEDDFIGMCTEIIL